MSRTGPAKQPEAGDFWSRRRAAVAKEEQADAAAEAEARQTEETQALEGKSDAEILEKLGLKDPDDLAQGDDFTAFLKSEVPERLRRRALRRLWLSNPVLANVDALVDYGDDFTDAATVVENLQTAYRVGKGMLAHIEKQLEDEPEDAAVEGAADDTGAETEAEDMAASSSSDTGASASDPGAPELEDESKPDERTQGLLGPSEDALTQAEALPSPRRMRFVYKGTPEDT